MEGLNGFFGAVFGALKSRCFVFKKLIINKR